MYKYKDFIIFSFLIPAIPIWLKNPRVKPPLLPVAVAVSEMDFFICGVTEPKVNSNLFQESEIEPAVSVDDYYDKYIVQGNTERKNVSLVFKTDTISNLLSILNINYIC